MFAWIAFISFILVLLALDLGVFHRNAHAVSPREGFAWSLVWMTLALAFSLVVYQLYGDGDAVVQYLTGYVIELSLSVDNMFVIAMLFRFFAVPATCQHRVLFWGILGALTMRALMIALGAALVVRFEWILYVFGVFLIVTAVKMLLLDTEHPDPSRNIVLRATRRVFPVTRRYHKHHFIVRRSGRILLTPLALALIMVETTDLIFAVDSIPAIFAVTTDPFLVFASNAFAILGLRSLYFVLVGALAAFRYLKVSLALVLALVGSKMLIHGWLEAVLGEHFNLYLLGAVLGILATGALASVLRPLAHPPRQEQMG